MADAKLSALSTNVKASTADLLYIADSNNTSKGITTSNFWLSQDRINSSLTSGILKTTSGTGVISVASGGVDYENVLSFGSPLIRKSNTITVNTDGSTTTFLRGDGVYSTPSGIVSYASSPIVFSGNSIGIQAATGAQPGYLSASNFNLFTAKASTAITITVKSPLSGGGDLSANRVIAIDTTNASGSTYWRGDFTWATPGGSGTTYDVRTPLLVAGSILSFNTNGTTSTFLNGAGVFTTPSGGGTTYSAATPILVVGNTFQINTTNAAAGNYYQGDFTWAVPASNSGIKLAVFTVFSSQTWTSDNVPIFQAPYETPITIKQINVTTSGSSPLLGFNMEMRPWGKLAFTGSSIFAGVQSAPTTGIEITSAISSPTILAKAHIFLTSSAIISGQADYITGTIYYIRNSI